MSNLIISTVCSGIGSPEQAMNELSQEFNFDHELGFYCEIDKYAKKSYDSNFKANHFVDDMTKSDWNGTEFYSDLFIGGIPCQAFSLAGLRKGELDPRGLLFYDYYRYVKQQQPKAFIIENVKGLLSDSNGKTFQNWLHLLGQSVNGHHQMFNSPDSLPYNLHWTVLNTKDFGIPQNRERVFIVGIRNDLPNTYRFPKPMLLKLRLKDILEPIVDEKYYLSDKMIDGYKVKIDGNQIGFINQDTQASKVFNTFNTLCAGTHGYANGYIEDKINNSDNLTKFGNSQDLKLSPLNGLSQTLSAGHFNQPKIMVKEATKQGYAIAKDGDSINFSQPNSTTRSGRVGEQIANTLDIQCNKAVVVSEISLTQIGTLYGNNSDAGRIYDSGGLARTIKSEGGGGGAKTGLYNVVHPVQLGKSEQFAATSELIGKPNGESYTIRACQPNGVLYNNRIRRLTPLECWRLQGFPDINFHNAQKVNSDSQLYKQAGNSMTANVIKAVIKNLLPIIS